MNKKQYESVIGIEIHLELKTKSKMFCGCDANHFGVKPNTHCCPVCLGLPGALPVPNKLAIKWCILLGQALNCTISSFSKFDRKNYFYSDLPKGYQISQYDKPIAVQGILKFKDKSFRIHRVHLEEDTGKLIHQGNFTLVDFNRSGVPLVEIVTEPDFQSSEDVVVFLKELHTIIRYLGISDADMEKGTMRIEPNISVRAIDGQTLKTSSRSLPNYKVEVKNINSFNFVKKAIDFEISRHIGLLEKGETPAQETRGWDSNKNITFSQRSKEEANDYRYFPEPDIPPMEFKDEELSEYKKEIPELPYDKAQRFVSDYNIRYIDAFELTRKKENADYYESALKYFSKLVSSSKISKIDSLDQSDSQAKSSGQILANLMINKKLHINLSPEEFAKKVLVVSTSYDADPNTMEKAVDAVLKSYPQQIITYKNGKKGLIGFFLGKVMEIMKGKADPRKLNEILKEKLDSDII